MNTKKGFYFWYNSSVLKKGWAALFLLFLSLSGFGQDPGPTTPGIDFILTGMRRSFDSGNRAEYLEAFITDLQAREGLVFDSFRESFKMTRVAFYPASKILNGDTGAYLFIQALFQNEQEALFETWKLGLKLDADRWIIRSKEVNGNPTVLYNLQIPSARVEKAARIVIRHADLAVTFENAWVFYDNLSQQETGLIIIGPGRMKFSPSAETERHQLFLKYKSDVLETGLVSAYLRFSPSFFETNIKITPMSGPATGTPPPAEILRARALFNRHYADSFTIENSLNGERLSFIPQSDQVVFELGTDSRNGFGYVYSPFSDEEVHFRSQNPDLLLCLYSPVVSGEIGRRMLVSFGEKFDVIRCDVDLDFQPSRFFISAKARVEVAARVPEVDSLRFDFNPTLDILGVYDKDGRELFYTQDKTRKLLYVYLLQPLKRDDSTSLEVYYRGILEPPIQNTEIISGAQLGVPSGLSDPNYDSYLYSRSAIWYPAPSEEDYFLSRLRISIPPDYSCVANGELTGEETIDEVRRVLNLEKIGNRISIFETTKPVKYLSFIVGKFKEINTENKTEIPPLRVLISEDIRSLRRGFLDDVRAIVRVYEQIFGPYPYEKLSIIQRVWPTAGGHSPASFVVLNELPKKPDSILMSDPQSPVDLPRYKEYFMAHEIAHQWWGQAVTGASYHDRWLSEGLAQYAAVRYLKSKYGEKALPSILKKYVEWTEKMSTYGPISLGPRLSLFDFRAFQAIVYGKSCVALFLLSDLIGEAVFDRGLKAFQEAHAFKSAQTRSFIKAMEQASGRDLGAFFRGWFDSYVLPKVFVTTDLVKDGDGFDLNIKVHQPENPFVFPLAVSWKEKDLLIKKTLDVDAQTKTFTFRVGSKPSKFKVNPDRLVPGTFKQ